MTVVMLTVLKHDGYHVRWQNEGRADASGSANPGFIAASALFNRISYGREIR